MDNTRLSKIKAAYEQYARQKREFDNTIIENHKWFRQQQQNNSIQKEKGQPDATSGYIFSAINVKHADAMDNYPEVNIFPGRRKTSKQRRI